MAAFSGGTLPLSPSHSAPSQAIRGPRRPFLVVLALVGLVGGVELTPALPESALPAMAPIPVLAGAPGGPAGAARAAIFAGPVDSAELERELVARFEHRPLARVLGGHTRDLRMADRIARALVKEARRLRVEPSLLAGVLLTENARLETGSVSSQGAIGLMQVMHFHAGEYDCASDDLLQVESNICHGSRVLGQYLRRTGDVRRALLRYNGCVSGANTPGCRRYPSKVLRTARTVRYELLRYPAYRLGLDSIPD
ncbi:MAG TPA: transglycosylase SLT domain-containing protein [Gemmatimonadales bacterium]|nr:transglycosylase SLT domain-containing protein [Gemmatimonadales bacterium]